MERKKRRKGATTNKGCVVKLNEGDRRGVSRAQGEVDSWGVHGRAAVFLAVSERARQRRAQRHGRIRARDTTKSRSWPLTRSPQA